MNDKDPIKSPEARQRSIGLLDRLLQAWGSFMAWIWSTSPGPDEQKWQKAIRALIRIHFIVFQEFRRDSITLRASALTYTVVLSMVPTLALGTAVLKGLGAGDQMRQAAYRIIDQLEPSGEGQGQRPAHVPAQEGLGIHLHKAVDQIFNYVDRTNFATLGAFGILGLVITAIAVLSSIEKAMNNIWNVRSGRALGRKIMDYLAFMILLPITINLAMATMATLQSPALLSRLQVILRVTWLGPLMLNMVPIVLIVATFSILYKFLPNTRVGVFPAMVGGLFGGIGWILIQFVYLRLQIGVARYNAIYGSFATLPLFLIWIYTGWIIFLSGAEMAFAVQVWRRYLWRGLVLNPVTRLALAFDIMQAILVDFRGRRVSDHASLVLHLRQPDVYIADVVKTLLSKGLLRRVDGKKDQFVPAAPADEINLAEIVDVICGTEVPPSPGGYLAEEVLKSAKSALTGRKWSIVTP